jgi:hypothetical protein
VNAGTPVDADRAVKAVEERLPVDNGEAVSMIDRDGVEAAVALGGEGAAQDADSDCGRWVTV